MIAFEVTLNGKRICVAGAEDLSVLSTIITASGILGAKTVPARTGNVRAEVFYTVGGLTARADPEKDVHLQWKEIAPLQVGDVIRVKVLEAKKADRAKFRKRAVRKPA
jgi:hypothetical protein